MLMCQFNIVTRSNPQYFGLIFIDKIIYKYERGKKFNPRALTQI